MLLTSSPLRVFRCSFSTLLTGWATPLVFTVAPTKTVDQLNSVSDFLSVVQADGGSIISEYRQVGVAVKVIGMVTVLHVVAIVATSTSILIDGLPVCLYPTV